jgi:hypothetical protein
MVMFGRDGLWSPPHLSPNFIVCWLSCFMKVAVDHLCFNEQVTTTAASRKGWMCLPFMMTDTTILQEHVGYYSETVNLGKGLGLKLSYCRKYWIPILLWLG